MQQGAGRTPLTFGNGAAGARQQQYAFEEVDASAQQHPPALQPLHSQHLFFTGDSLGELGTHVHERGFKAASPPSHLQSVLPAHAHHAYSHLAALPPPPDPHVDARLLPQHQPPPRLPAHQLLANPRLFPPTQAPRQQPRAAQQAANAAQLLSGPSMFPERAPSAPALRQVASAASSSAPPVPPMRPHAANAPADPDPSSAWAPLVAQARRRADFWAVLRESTLAQQWALRGTAECGEPARSAALARGAVSMYVCDGCACPRTLLRRHASMLFPARGASGVVVGHYIERIHTAAPSARIVHGRYVLCARSRELLKLRPADDGTALALSRAVALGAGAVLRDFVQLAVAPAAQLPDVVIARTSVLHVGVPDSPDAPPFIPLDLGATAAAALAIDPSAGVSGFGDHPMALFDIDPRGTSPPLADGSWAPPTHCSQCARPKWALQKLERSDAMVLRNVFQTHFASPRSQAQPARRLAKRPQSPPRIAHAAAMELAHISLSDDAGATASGVATAPSATVSPQPLLQAAPAADNPADEHAASSVDEPLCSVDAIKAGAALFCAPVDTSRPPRLRPATAPVPLAPASKLDSVPHSAKLSTSNGRVRKKVDTLPAPSPSDVVMRNRISAQRSNEKRRKQHHLIRLEVAYLHDTIIPRLKMRHMLLVRENEQLRSSFSTKYTGMSFVSFYGTAT